MVSCWLPNGELREMSHLQSTTGRSKQGKYWVNTGIRMRRWVMVRKGVRTSYKVGPPSHKLVNKPI